jgi:hypothetical protein
MLHFETEPKQRHARRSHLGNYGVSAQVSFRSMSPFCPPNMIEWPSFGK